MRPKRTKHAPRKIRLSELSVRKAKPLGAAYLIWDTTQRGLALRVQPSGRRSWVAIYSRHGRPRWLYLGDAGAIGLADARVFAAEALLSVAKGKDPAAEKRAERGVGTFAELAAKYVEQHAKVHNKSWRQAETLIRGHVLPRWGKLQATTITRADVKALKARITAPILANQVLAATSAIFTWAIKEDIVGGNPCKLIDRNKTKSRERVLSDSEVPTFWKTFDEIGVQGAALRMILLTGQRPGEVASMRREHIRDGWWELPGEPVPAIGWPGTKNGESHRVWIPEPALAGGSIAGDDAAAGFVFRGRHGRAVDKLDKVMRDICARLGIERATPHDLRRTHGSTITALGFGRDAMNRIQNHKEGGIASVYDRHGYADENKRVMESVASKIISLVEGRSDSGKIVHLR